MTGSHTDSYCMTPCFLPPTCPSLRLWFSQQHWFKRCCPSPVQYNINHKNEKKLDQALASLINDPNSPLFKRSLVTIRVEYMREYYLGESRRADIRQWAEWQLCRGQMNQSETSGDMSMWWGGGRLGRWVPFSQLITPRHGPIIKERENFPPSLAPGLSSLIFITIHTEERRVWL